MENGEFSDASSILHFPLSISPFPFRRISRALLKIGLFWSASDGVSFDLGGTCPGERPLGVRDGSGSFKRFSVCADGSWSFMISIGCG